MKSFRDNTKSTSFSAVTDLLDVRNHGITQRTIPMFFSRRTWSIALVLLSPAAFAANLCVAPNGAGGCQASITAAIAAAAAHDIIRVAPGTYAEDVVVDKPLALLGADNGLTVIDATGLSNGIDVDGKGHPGLGQVIVQGFTVENANFQGILVTNATDVTIKDNHVKGNDRSLQPFAEGGPVCPGLPPYFVAGEGFDCGEGIHLSGVTGSTVSDNLVEHNAGGILVSDDTGPNHDNYITGNIVSDNPYDCGITLASHHFSLGPTDPLLGVYHITVENNTSARNGLQTGEGAGVGVFSGPPGAQNWGDVIIGNRIFGNALPGVALHSHTVFQKLTDHLIANNTIYGNGPDSDPGTTVPTGIVVFSDASGGAPPINGVRIVGNTIFGEGIDVAARTSGGEIAVHQNNLFDAIGVENLGVGTIDATLNWWKCSKGPGANGCGNISGADVLVAPWLNQPEH